MNKFPSRLFSRGALVATVACAVGCADHKATALVVAYSADSSVLQVIKQVEISAARGAEPSFSQPYDVPADIRFPATLTFSKIEDAPNSQSVLYKIVGMDETGKARITKQARLGFVEEHTKLLKMALEQSCLDHDPCKETETCSRGVCVPDAIDPGGLPDFTSNGDALAAGGASGAAGIGGSGGTAGTAGTAGSSGAGGAGGTGGNIILDCETPSVSTGNSISLGDGHGCVIVEGGTVSCWGESYGGIRFFSTDPFFNEYVASATNVPLPADSYVRVISGFDSDCVLTASHGLRCWGNNSLGTLAAGPATPTGTTVPFADKVIDACLDYFHACAVVGAAATDTSGNVYCWGTNDVGELASTPNPAFASQPTPTIVEGIAGAVEVSTEHQTHVTCARISDGSVSCWGGDTTNWQVAQVVASGAEEIELGNFTNPTLFYRTSTGDVMFSERTAGGIWTTAAAVTSMGKVSSISAGTTLCGVDLADSTLLRCTVYPGSAGFPVEDLQLPAKIQSVSAGTDAIESTYYQCVTLVDGRSMCRGSDYEGKLGTGKPENIRLPLLVDLQGSHPAALVVSNGGTVVQVEDHSLRAWGIDPSLFGDQGTHTPQQPIETGVSVGESVVMSVSPSGNSMYLLGTTVRKSVSGGHVENPSTGLFAGPTPDATEFLRVVAGATIDIGSTVDTVYAYASAQATPNTSHLLPDVPVEGLNTILTGVAVEEIAYRSDAAQSDYGGHACVRLTSGEVRCWGNNISGETGQPLSSTPTWPPVVVDVTPGVPLQAVSLCGGHEFTCAVTASGDVYCWGNNTHRASRPNESSQNGDNTLTLVTTLVGAGPYHVSCGEKQSCAWTSSAVTCWGENDDGQLGDPTVAFSAGSGLVSVTNMPPAGFETVLDVALSEYHTCALVGGQQGSGVACWGGNVYGAVGNGPSGIVTSFARVCGIDAP